MDLRQHYRVLFKKYGPQQWWPAQASEPEARALEICVGAILTQNTNWQNVEHALERLRQARVLSFPKLLGMPEDQLAEHIRPSGYYHEKAKKLRTFLTFVRSEYGASFQRMFEQPTMSLRQQLLGIHGIGKETADSMLLYAGNKPIFVIDSYCKRWLKKKGIEFEEYDEYREFFEKHLPRNVKLYQDFHALIVAWGKDRG